MRCGKSVGPGTCLNTNCAQVNRPEAKFCGHCGSDHLAKPRSAPFKPVRTPQAPWAAEPPALAPAAERSGPAGLLAAVGAAAALAVGWWLLHSGKGLPVTEAMRKNVPQGFAAAAPDGFDADWTESPADAAGWRTVAAFTGTAEGGFAPIMAIRSLPAPAVKVTLDRKDGLAKGPFFESVRSAVDMWNLDAAKAERVDMLGSLRVEGGGPKHVKRTIPRVVVNETGAFEYWRKKYPGQPIPAFQTVASGGHGILGLGGSVGYVVEEERVEEADYYLLSGGVLVPGRRRSYLLSYVCDRAMRTACQQAFDGLVSSFRVLERPRPLDALKAGD